MTDTCPPAGQFRLEVQDGKYTLVQPDQGDAHVLRYGDEWLAPGFDGNKYLVEMAYESNERREEIARLRTALTDLHHHASQVARLGASTGAQWSGLSASLVKTQAALLSASS